MGVVKGDTRSLDYSSHGGSWVVITVGIRRITIVTPEIKLVTSFLGV